jgi:hypothetical protein
MGREREQYMDEHNHGGEPSYFAYVHLHCRHDDCYGAMREYKSRPKSGEGKVVQLPASYAEVEEVELVAQPVASEVHVEPMAATEAVEIADTDAVANTAQDREPDRQAEVIQALARKIFAILQTCRLNLATGELNESLVKVVPSLVGITSAQFGYFIDAFVANGMLERKDSRLYLRDRSPDGSAVAGLIEQVLGRARDGLDRAA